jgi:hypothetical protein
MDIENDYVPRCRPCHFAYDRDQHFNEDTLSRWREGFMKYWTPEKRKEYSDRMKERRNHGDLRELNNRTKASPGCPSRGFLVCSEVIV